MCGIIVTKKPGMAEMIRHRGTSTFETGWGVWTLGHAWLPIQTDRDGGTPQPIQLHGACEGKMLLYNGEIYNYPERYADDTSYLKDMLETWGVEGTMREASFRQWDGMWAVVVADASGMLQAFTDPLGKKQLYYNKAGEICSEAAPLAHEGAMEDPLWRSQAMKWGYPTGTRTPWAGVSKMLPGRLHTFRWSPYGCEPEVGPYEWDWSAPWHDQMKGVQPWEKSVQMVSDALRESVLRRVKSFHGRHPVAVLLSGGLDSSIVACLLKGCGADVRLYSLEGLDEEDERCACEAAKALGQEIRWVSPEWMADDRFLLSCLAWNESPVDLGSLTAQHLLCRAVAEDGIDIALTGDGADELFGGYSRDALYDSQLSDVFEELTWYHLPRLDRASMRWTVELRSPMLGHSVAALGLSLPRAHRRGKSVIKDAFRGIVPDAVLDRPKVPLKAPGLVKDPMAWRSKCHDLFYKKVICKPINAKKEYGKNFEVHQSA